MPYIVTHGDTIMQVKEGKTGNLLAEKKHTLLHLKGETQPISRRIPWIHHSICIRYWCNAHLLRRKMPDNGSE